MINDVKYAAFGTSLNQLRTGYIEYITRMSVVQDISH